ncbi:DNA sulfur modification protein DndB [Paraburkholderia youngii]|uniref:DGQHR domain-containing protein n=1 Tax=Paraburkholderia youngii TaxID=2782701 RepID=A0ABX2NYM6_9BURK|nr:DNA sulfur modification protein DndB [Paraburkholderia youngii]NVI09252.1 hypothetical protein [Paraburkholderia youngii]
MSFNFNIQKLHAYGSYGDFSVGTGANQIRAQYLLTKIRPGQQGSWENQLATQMAPWREIFSIEELSFDELIQRDLDDSRVAHDLIPYLLGETGQHARFFPPVLAVLVPKREDRSGISPYYPSSKIDGEKVSFGDIFDFSKMKFNETVTPLGEVSYNQQRTAVVIVDGQHRAMAVLALHRQLNKTWGSNPFAPYYDHIRITPEAVAHIELPVCLLWFPDLTEDAELFKAAGINLISVCREIFTVVNRQAKQVSKSRELLLDDEDFAAFMMRRTLTTFKDRAGVDRSARIYSFAFGDSESDAGSQVMAGQLEFCSAVALHKMHAATGFGFPAAFNLTRTVDVTDGRNIRNPTRPIELLNGSGGPVFQSLSRRSAKTHAPQDVEDVTRLIGDITDCIMLPLFDRLRPFMAHTQAMTELLEALNDATAKADPVQNKVRTLLFDGSGNRNVFDEHIDRLKERAKELEDKGQPIPTHLSQQLIYCDAVTRALQSREDEVKARRAFILFNIDQASFLSRDKSVVEPEMRTLRARAKAIFDTSSTQAFQIGYLMAVLTQVEILLPPSATYEVRLKITKFVSELFVKGFGSLFAVTQTTHRTLTGFVTEGRARAFETAEPGFRGLLHSTNVRELNEKQWEFFRYMVFEVVHSKSASAAVLEVLDAPENADVAAIYRDKLAAVLNDVEILRNRYFEAAFRTATNTPEFKRTIDLLKLTATSEGKSEEQIKAIVDLEVVKEKARILEVSKGHLKATLGRIDSRKQVLARLVPSGSHDGGDDESESPLENDLMEQSDAGTEDAIETAIVADELLSDPEPMPETDDINKAESQKGES